MTTQRTGGPHPVIRAMRDARRARKVSAETLGDATGIHANTIGSWERGLNMAPVDKVDTCLAHIGQRLAVVPVDAWVFAARVDDNGVPRTVEVLAAPARPVDNAAATLARVRAVAERWEQEFDGYSGGGAMLDEILAALNGGNDQQ